MSDDNRAIRVEMTDATEFHCFQMTLRPRSAPDQQITIMLHAKALVDLIHECSSALCDWQKQTTTYLILEKTGLSEDEARHQGLIA
jgi:hypothetical protein